MAIASPTHISRQSAKQISSKPDKQASPNMANVPVSMAFGVIQPCATEAAGLGLERLPSTLEEAVQAAQESEFLHRVLPEELSHRYYEEELKRCAALKAAADPAEYERVHYFNAI